MILSERTEKDLHSKFDGMYGIYRTSQEIFAEIGRVEESVQISPRRFLVVGDVARLAAEPYPRSYAWVSGAVPTDEVRNLRFLYVYSRQMDDARLFVDFSFSIKAQEETVF